MNLKNVEYYTILTVLLLFVARYTMELLGATKERDDLIDETQYVSMWRAICDKTRGLQV